MSHIDVLSPIAEANVIIKGHLGKAVDSCIRNGVMKVDYELYIKPFAEKSDEGGAFQGEFWGKWFTSAVAAYKLHPTVEYQKILDGAIEGILHRKKMAESAVTRRISGIGTFGDANM